VVDPDRAFVAFADSESRVKCPVTIIRNRDRNRQAARVNPMACL
jgi:hypothetical protein